MVKTLLTILIIYLILKYVARLFNVATDSGSSSQGGSRQPDITVTRSPESGRHSRLNDDDAEYVDYDEVD